MVLTPNFNCTHCGEKGQGRVSEVTGTNHLVYPPKDWLIVTYDRHLCKRCKKEYLKQSESFFTK